MVAFHNGFSMCRRWFVLLTLVTFGLALGIGAFLWHAVQTSSVIAIQIRVEAIKPIIAIIRLLVISLVALSWPGIVGAFYRWGRVDEIGATRLLSLRWRIVTWLVVFELMIGQNLLSSFLAAIQSDSA